MNSCSFKVSYSILVAWSPEQSMHALSNSAPKFVDFLLLSPSWHYLPMHIFIYKMPCLPPNTSFPSSSSARSFGMFHNELIKHTWVPFLKGEVIQYWEKRICLLLAKYGRRCSNCFLSPHFNKENITSFDYSYYSNSRRHIGALLTFASNLAQFRFLDLAPLERKRPSHNLELATTISSWCGKSQSAHCLVLLCQNGEQEHIDTPAP